MGDPGGYFAGRGDRADRRPVPSLPAVVPSLLAADFVRLGEEVAAAEEAGARWFQLDVMDGHFVPNLSFGVPVLESLRPATDSFLDAHLMITAPHTLLEAFAGAGADLITIHAEASEDPRRDLETIRGLGCQCGFAVSPPTPASAAVDALEIADLVLVMTVNPGFGGQRFMPETLAKIGELREAASRRGVSPPVFQVDGGIDSDTAAVAARAGAQSYVAGSSVFRGAGGAGPSFRRLQSTVEEARHWEG